MVWRQQAIAEHAIGAFEIRDLKSDTTAVY